MADQSADRAVHIREDLSTLGGHFKGDVFYGCTFRKLNGLVLESCDLNASSFNTDKIEDALGFTVTLNCLSFGNVTLSPLVFDLILCLLMKTAGNAEKRRKLIDVIGKDRVRTLLEAMKDLE